MPTGRTTIGSRRSCRATSTGSQPATCPHSLASLSHQPTIPLPTVTAPVNVPTSGVPSAGGLPALPATLPLDHAACFRVEADGSYSLDELVDRLGGSADARTRLQQWGWQGSVYRTYACDTPPKGEAGWIDVAVHRFADAASAQQALDYFTAERAQGTNLFSGTPPAHGRPGECPLRTHEQRHRVHALCHLGSPADPGDRSLPDRDTVHQRHESGLGNPLDPTAAGTTRACPDPHTHDCGAAHVPSPAPSPAPQAPASLPASAYLPSTLPVPSASCFAVADQGVYSYETVQSFLTNAGASEETIAALDWQDGAYIDFRCPNPPSGGASVLETVVHRFGSAQAAKAAAPYWQSGYVPAQPHEVYVCESAGTFVVCADGRSPTVTPTTDVHALLTRWPPPFPVGPRPRPCRNRRKR